MTTLFLDSETFCERPISVGVNAYAETAEVMIASWAIDDGPVQVYDFTQPNARPVTSLNKLVERADIVVMHNSMFDRTVLRHQGVVIPAEMVHDTMVQAMSHGLPGALGTLGVIFALPEDIAKHQGGKELIQIFCKPAPKNQLVRRRTRETDPKKWAEFLAYAGGDIHAMRYLYKKMPRWNYPTREHALWCLDQKINDRGFKVDLDLAEGAITAVKESKVEGNAAAADLTDGRVRSTQQRDALLQELLLEYGVKLPDLQGSTIERRLEDPDLPAEVKELLGNRLMMSTSSVSKYNKIVKAASADGRLRGSLRFSGAPRTKRWSGQLFQPQNLPRPDMEQEEIELAIAAFKSGAGFYILDDPMRAAWNCLRGLIIAEEGHKLVQADLSGIEARILPWLAGEDWKLQVFRDLDAGTGPDVYRATASRLLGIPVEEVTGKQRQSHGKVVELACGYGGSKGAFAQFAALYRVEMSEAEIMAAVRGWREAHPKIADWNEGLWALLDQAARQAIAQPGKIVAAGEHIHFEVWRSWMKMHLPSGGFLSYASPKIIADERMGGDTVSFQGLNNYTRKWERLTTYGGKLSADATQSTARELIAENMQHVEDAGYPIILTVHDEVITEPLDDRNYSVTTLCELLARRPDWIDDKLPLSAGGFEAARYRKD